MSTLSLESFVTRRVRLPRPPCPIDLSLSQSLFSSHEVDRGSALLLKSLERTPRGLPHDPMILDVGSGTGVLGICLGRSLPGARVWFQDRDALAVAFTECNCAGNGIEPVLAQGELGLQGLGETRFDLIVSNLPAKAGEPVHADLLRRAGRHLRPGALACFVVVKPLAGRIQDYLAAAGLTAERASSTGTHVVFHARAQAQGDSGTDGRTGDRDDTGGPDPLRCYLRARSSFRHGSLAWEMDVAHDLAEFDTLSYGTSLALDMAVGAWSQRGTGNVLVLNPGQGHVPAALAELAANGAEPVGRLTLAGRDLLALRVSARNASRSKPCCAHVWDPAAIQGTYSLMVLFPDDEPHVRWEEHLPEFARQRLEHGAHAVVSASATFVTRMLRNSGGLELIRSRKKEGFRCVLLRKP